MPEQLNQIINKMTGTVSTDGEDIKTENNYGSQQFFCDAKSQGQLNDFIDVERPKLVALVGFADYGKFTFIGSLYHRLIQDITYERYALVDSETYVGFERRIFLRRPNVNNTSDTKRNILRENDILNLNLKAENGVLHQVLVSDKAGETYSKYISSDVETRSDIVLEKSDLVIFFVDAEVDCRSLKEHNLIIEQYGSLLTRLKVHNKIGIQTKYVIVFTKFDKVSTDDLRSKFKTRSKEICLMFTDKIGVASQNNYEVDSTTLENENLNKVFSELIKPIELNEVDKEVDWVKEIMK